MTTGRKILIGILSLGVLTGAGIFIYKAFQVPNTTPATGADIKTDSGVANTGSGSSANTGTYSPGNAPPGTRPGANKAATAGRG